MQVVDEATVTVDGGLAGDHKGPKFPRRQLTLLALEDWQAALAALSSATGTAVQLPWTVRRANLLVEGVRLPRAVGARLRIGPVLIEVTYPTTPCRRMDAAFPGLMKALSPDWRGGVTSRVLEGGELRLGDAVSIVSSPPEHTMRLPG
jgi:MOSC domain-containing protein YiiM